MLTTIEDLLKKMCSLKEFLKKELLSDPPDPAEKKALKKAIRTIRGVRKELRRIRKRIQVDDTLEYLEKQKEKIDKIVVGMMLGYIQTLMDC
ncbi:unnamed protein product [Caenorhabditis brenneri]